MLHPSRGMKRGIRDKNGLRKRLSSSATPAELRSTADSEYYILGSKRFWVFTKQKKYSIASSQTNNFMCYSKHILKSQLDSFNSNTLQHAFFIAHFPSAPTYAGRHLHIPHFWLHDHACLEKPYSRVLSLTLYNYYCSCVTRCCWKKMVL